MMKSQFTFTNAEGQALSGRLERPLQGTSRYALFAHCFTCSKDIAAASRISRALVAQGIAVLRFDFTGIGNSEGDFANTNFSSNVQDLVQAAQRLEEVAQAPQLLIGHSLGGAAVLAAAHRIPQVRAVVTIGAPADPAHVTHLLKDDLETIEAEGCANVDLAGRSFAIKRQFIEDLREHKMQDYLRKMDAALLIFHSPQDELVSVDEAKQIYVQAKHPKSFISLDKADHLLTKKRDSEYVAQTLSAWASRYLHEDEATAGPTAVPAGQVVVQSLGGKFAQSVTAGRHHSVADEPLSVGGDDAGPSPYDLLLSGLGACTAMTLQMYAARKGWALEHVSVSLVHERVHAKDCEQCPEVDAKVERITKQVTLRGDLDDSQRERLLQIADRCPVHRTLHAQPTIVTRLTEE